MTSVSFVRRVLVAACCAQLAGCGSAPSTGGSTGLPTLPGGAGVTASDAALATRSGFLSDYRRLAGVPGVEGARCWRQPGVAWRNFDRILITRMEVTLKPRQHARIDPADLKQLLDYFHASLVTALAPEMPVAAQAGPGVLVMRIALTDLTPTNVAESLVGTATPYGFVAEMAAGTVTGRPPGATPYLGETGIEVQFRDGATHAIVAECEDTEVGRKYAADINAGAAGAAEAWVGGYVNSFTAWSYARDAFDKWSALLAKRIAALRAA